MKGKWIVKRISAMHFQEFNFGTKEEALDFSYQSTKGFRGHILEIIDPVGKVFMNERDFFDYWMERGLKK